MTATRQPSISVTRGSSREKSVLFGYPRRPSPVHLTQASFSTQKVSSARRLVRGGVELRLFPGGQNFLRQSEIYVPVKLLGVNARSPGGTGRKRPPGGVGNGKMPAAVGEIGLAARRYGNGGKSSPVSSR